jgi:UDP-2,3-diacylglucosamine pyrophosphatase LpxH
MIVAVSDVHIGTLSKGESLFRTFLDTVAAEKEVEHLVLMGDILDLWRGNPDTLFERYADILERLKELQRKKNVYYIHGNHDYHITKREDIKRQYAIDVRPHLILSSGTHKYFFVHGYQFEFSDNIELYEEFFNILCLRGDVMAVTGEFFWNVYQEIISAVTMSKAWFLKNFTRSLNPPQKRLNRKDMKEINEAITVWRKDNNSWLVYGHTHDPFVDEEHCIANTGSWMDDPYYPHLEKYTYITIDDGVITLHFFT